MLHCVVVVFHNTFSLLLAPIVNFSSFLSSFCLVFVNLHHTFPPSFSSFVLVIIHFFSIFFLQEQCLACSQCPINKIIISPCQGLHDTKCGPFYDFKSFNAADGKNKGNITPYEQSGKDDSADFKDASLYEDQTSSEDIGTLETEWKSLTVALIVLVSVLFISVIFLVFYFLRRRNMNKKEIICEYSPPIEHV